MASGLTFPIPEGFEPPGDIKDGAEFEALATLKLVGGKLELCEIDGAKLGGYKEEEEEEAPAEVESTDARRSRMMGSMNKDY